MSRLRRSRLAIVLVLLLSATLVFGDTFFSRKTVLTGKTTGIGRFMVAGFTPTAGGTGFGTTGTFAADTGSSDLAGILHGTAGGTGIAALGTFTLTFSDANYGTNIPVCTATLMNGTGTWNVRATIRIDGSSWTNQYVFNWDNNAVALTTAQIYKLSYICFGK